MEVKKALKKAGDGIILAPFIVVAGVVLFSFLAIGMVGDQVNKLRKKK